MNAWALLVVSSEAQAESLAHQRAWAEETAKAKGWDLHPGGIFEGVSTGKGGPRKKLLELVAELRKLDRPARPQWLLMLRADRVGRGRIADSQIVQHEINDLGVRIWTRNEGELKLDSAMDQLIAAVRATTAAFENEVKREKMIAVYRRRRALGLPDGMKRPYGLTAGPDGHDVAVDDAAQIVRQIFALRIELHGYNNIARRVGPIAPPYRYKNGDSKPLHWTARRIRAILSNASYVGPVVDELTWHRAQAVSNQVSRAWPKTTHPWPLSGAVRCYCGYGVHGRSSGRQGGARYYACMARWNHDNHLRYVPAEALEQQFVDLLEDLKKRPHLVAEYRAAATNGPSPALLDRSIADARAEVTGLNLRRERVWELNAAGTVRNEDVQEQLDVLARSRDEHLARVAELESQRAMAVAATRRVTDSTALIAKAARLYKKATADEQRALARAVSLDLGGLCVEEDRSLSVRTPPQAGKYERRTKAM